MSRRNAGSSVVIVVALGACGPRLESLASHRHYREAVCAASDGSSDDRAYLRRVLAVDADPQLHVEVVPPGQIIEVLDGRGDPERIAARARFVRVRLDTNTLPLDGLDASIAWRSAHRVVGAPIEWSTLVAITGETEPPPESYSTYFHRGTAWRLLGAFFTFGASLPFTRFRARTYTREAPPQVYERETPAAYRLHAAMQHATGCRHVAGASRGVGLSCEWFVALDPAADSLSLELAVGYGAKRATARADGCRVTHSMTIALGSLRDLSVRTARTFGPRTRPVRELVLDR